jgi:hypothetical protein
LNEWGIPVIFPNIMKKHEDAHHCFLSNDSLDIKSQHISIRENRYTRVGNKNFKQSVFHVTEYFKNL